MRLKLKCVMLLSTSAFKLELRRYMKGTLLEPEVGGSLRLSKGTAFIQPSAGPGGGANGAGPSSASTGFISSGRNRGLAGFLQRSTPPGSPAKAGTHT